MIQWPYKWLGVQIHIRPASKMKKSNKNTMWGYFEFELFVIVCVRACVRVHGQNAGHWIEGNGENGNLFKVEIFPRGVKGCGTEKMKRAHQDKSCVYMWVCVWVWEGGRGRERESNVTQSVVHVLDCQSVGVSNPHPPYRNMNNYTLGHQNMNKT